MVTFIIHKSLHVLPSVLWRCWLGGRKGIRPVKNWVVGCWRGYYLERGADLHMAQLMPLPLTVSCFSKIHIGLTFLVPAHLGSPRQRAVKLVCAALSRRLLGYLQSSSIWWHRVQTTTNCCTYEQSGPLFHLATSHLMMSGRCFYMPHSGQSSTRFLKLFTELAETTVLSSQPLRKARRRCPRQQAMRSWELDRQQAIRNTKHWRISLTYTTMNEYSRVMRVLMRSKLFNFTEAGSTSVHVHIT